MNAVVVIPARLESTRLPNKVLLDLDGKSVLHRVYEQCLIAANIDAVFIATDSQKIKSECEIFTDNIILTSKDHTSGTQRIAQAIKEINCKAVVNVQGDEPFIDPLLITKIAETTLSSSASVCSAMQLLNNAEDFLNPNIVKVVSSKNNMALYFSRSPIPYPRDAFEQIIHSGSLPTQTKFYKHIGIYGYKRDFLLTYEQLPSSQLEDCERLEQLKILDAGGSIEMITATNDAFGIDTQQDYQNAIAKIQGQANDK